MQYFSRSCVLVALAALAGPALSLPGYAKALRTPCLTCHSVPPRLNATGKAFSERGPSAIGLDWEARGIPASVWLSGLGQNIQNAPNSVRTTINRVEAIWFGPLDGNTSLFVEWRAVSNEFTADGAIRDRSGRFEDLFITHRSGPIEWTLGQARALAQLDASQRLTLSEPLVLSRSLAGTPDSDPRTQSLRGFSLGGRSPLIRVAWRALDEAGSWNASIASAFPGEFSLPLTGEARKTASHEFEQDVKGYLGEVYRRTGETTLGIFAFSGRNQREISGVATSTNLGKVWIEGAAAKTRQRSAGEWVGSLDVSARLTHLAFAGVRVDGREESRPIWVPYVAAYSQDRAGAWKLTLEARSQKGRHPVTALEIGRLF